MRCIEYKIISYQGADFGDVLCDLLMYNVGIIVQFVGFTFVHWEVELCTIFSSQIVIMFQIWCHIGWNNLGSKVGDQVTKLFKKFKFESEQFRAKSRGLGHQTILGLGYFNKNQICIQKQMIRLLNYSGVENFS